MSDRADSDVVEPRAADQESARDLSTQDRSAQDLSAQDLLAWIDALRALPAPPPAERDIIAWVDDALRPFLPFSGFLAGYGKWSGGRIHVLSCLASGHCPEYVASRPKVFDLNTRAALAWWIHHQKPFLADEKGCVDEDGAPIPASDVELEGNLRFSLGLTAVYGVFDPVGKCGTHVCLSGLPRAQSKRAIAAIKLIAPVLHTLFLQTRRMTFSDLTVLTGRQRELLDLALGGLSDKAIASRLRISDNTVGHHFQAIYAKLGVSKRSELIALLK